MTKKKEMKKRRFPKSYTGKTLVIYLILRALVIFTLVMAAIRGNYENVLLCVLTLILFYVPDILQRGLDIHLPDTLEIIILVFIFAAEILGEIQAFYIRIPIWDTMLHTTTGFLAAAVGFSLVDLLNRHERFSFEMSPIYMAIVAFCFSMTIGVLWEFFEFSADLFLRCLLYTSVIAESDCVHPVYTGLFQPPHIVGVMDDTHGIGFVILSHPCIGMTQVRQRC